MRLLQNVFAMRRSRLTLVAVISGAGIGVVVLAAFSRAGDPRPTLLVSSRTARTRGISSAVAEWSTSGGYGGAHYGSAADITPDNVRALEVAWVYRTGDVSDGTHDTVATSFQATPVLSEGTLYFPTPFSRVIALDAETGAERWTFDPHIDRSSRLRKYVTSRGVAIWNDSARRHAGTCERRVFVATIDARLISLDASSGTLCQEFGDDGSLDLRVGVRNIVPEIIDYKQTSPPAVFGDLVIVGSSVNDNGRAAAPSGVVRAFDARTGRVRWMWEPLVDVERHSATGDTTFVSGAANAWAALTVDTARGIVFIPTGSASPDHYGGLRPGDNRHANSVVALNARTGTVIWAFQLVHHDLWDYDVAAQPALADVRRGRDTIPVVIASSKASSVFFLRRETGAPLFPVEERPVPASDVPGERVSPTQPFATVPRPLAPQTLTSDDAWGLTPADRAWCRKRIASLRSEGIYTPPSVRGTIVFPGFVGGMAWGGFAIDNDRGLLITVANKLPSIATLVPRSADSVKRDGVSVLEAIGPQRGTPYGARRDLLLSPIKLPCTKPPWGTLVAVDMATGAVKWEVPLGTMSDFTHTPMPAAWGSVALGGPMATAGGMIFVGASMDHRLHAFDARNGRLLWEGKLPASAQATPMTYRARPGGRQYVVVAAGGHALMHSKLGDYVIAYALR